MAYSKPIGRWSRDDACQFESSDRISDVFDEISMCVRQDEGHGAFDAFQQEAENEATSSKPTVSCGMCVSHVRVERVSQLKKGQHIAMPGKRIGHAYDSSKRKQEWVYMHHAIVKDIVAMDDKKYIAEVKLIHMWQNERGELGLCDSVTTFALTHDELYIVVYRHPRYTPSQIVERAEKALNDRENAHTECKKIRFSDYNVVTTNCEHFATWCVVGLSKSHKELHWWKQLGQKILEIGESTQVMALKARIVEIFGQGSMVVKLLSKFLAKFSFDSSDEIAKLVNVGMPEASTVLGGAAAFYVLYCLVMTIYFHVKYTRNEICMSCYRDNITDLWARCSLYGITSVATYFIMSGCVCVPAVTSCFMLIVLSIAVQHHIPNIRKALMAPYGCEKKAIYRLDDLKVGDIVTIQYWGLPHDVIVTEVHPNGRLRRGKIRAIHYALDKLFSTREVKEEYFPTASNLSRLGWPILKRHECAHLNLFPPETAVLRARQRIGERKWHATKNRSDHVCYWAKVRQQLTEEDKPQGLAQGLTDYVTGKGQSPHLSTLFIGEHEVHLSSDFDIGDVIKVKETEGIVVGKDCGERKMNLQLITVKGSVKQLKQFVNLNTDNATVLQYHPAHCHPKATRADRARLIRGQKISMQNFKDFCILLKS
ncbi:uncharacterized protein LOC123539128 [Mercenaria mercenaria]|uniref:uncharacterized protein LOC123539128 n=1 Tax=Mercenaria mercenaria TaxID=6596 RepID=UPI00234F3C4D|nr:uncharacterized protein LOC123539128 [Mercenaria mercenaria]XP_045179550.2 uncharacterized protein LOC123539128 [Mercenaria mercenaria]XP_045179551.2 uncharacterized protein LOC123539128 [Mercenaria mercenaria]